MAFCFLVLWSVSHRWLPSALWSQRGFSPGCRLQVMSRTSPCVSVLWPMLRGQGLLMAKASYGGWQKERLAELAMCFQTYAMKRFFVTSIGQTSLMTKTMVYEARTCSSSTRKTNGGGFGINATTYHSAPEYTNNVVYLRRQQYSFLGCFLHLYKATDGSFEFNTDLTKDRLLFNIHWMIHFLNWICELE